MIIGAALLADVGRTELLDFVYPVPTALVVLGSLMGRRAWSQRVLGEGAEEFRRLGLGMLTAAVVLALAAALFGLLDLRPWAFVVVPVVAVVVVVARYALRQRLHRARAKGRCTLPVVAAGGAGSIQDLVERVRANPHVGWRVEAACIANPGADHARAGEISGVPIVGGLDDLAEQVRRTGYRIVAVTPDSYWTQSRLQRLAWDLEGTSAELVVAPVLMEVGGPRLNVSGVLGMPMLRVVPPAFTGGRRFVKEVVDRLGAGVALALTAPLLVLIAAAIKLDGGGHVFYSQRRVKRDGETFWMWKFRTMRVGADAERVSLAAANEAQGPLFKVRGDPRVTRVGSVLRRFSIDELPQLFNVLAGSMSLVGPRPPLPEESRTYDPDVGRRLLVKPGMTGLWQVSGRSDLSWEDSVRLDLRYVEDWSLALDAAILWKTVRAVVQGKGAY
ncbi:sugar transferase [Prauserella halophila]|uniref:Sugar transferase n=1 Tax=Prauserella halophila TaxID=185641 RepID=A0ABP4H4N9_9PSEU